MLGLVDWPVYPHLRLIMQASKGGGNVDRLRRAPPRLRVDLPRLAAL